jgi:hypothetical protein
MERDEVYVPKTRSDLGLPAADEADENAYDELLGDTPIYTLFMLVRQQFLAFPAYLRTSRSRSQCFTLIASSLQCLWPKDVSEVDESF